MNTDGGGTEIAYNVIHDVKTIPHYSPSFANGIYLDDNSPNFLVHHNVVYNINSPGYASTGIVLHTETSNNNQVYNNTIWNVQSDNLRDYDGGIQADGDSNVKIYNNLINTQIQGEMQAPTFKTISLLQARASSTPQARLPPDCRFTCDRRRPPDPRHHRRIRWFGP